MIETMVSLLGSYEWRLSLYTAVAVFLLPKLAGYLLIRLPGFKQTHELNTEVAEKQKRKSFYNPVQKRSKIWGLSTVIATYVLVLPFCITTESQPWWNVFLDCFVILMFYDFFYYLTHRFIFHDGGFGRPGPLLKVHAVHHQQKNPCRLDSNYIHPLETCIGLGLYAGSIAALAALMGDFHIVTIIITYIAFSAINQHNHDLMEVNHFPFKYLHYMSFMHHVHHKNFSSGNYATISLFYDWLFGTYDKGEGWRKEGTQTAD